MSRFVAVLLVLGFGLGQVSAAPQWSVPPVLHAGTINEVDGWDTVALGGFTVEVARANQKPLVVVKGQLRGPLDLGAARVVQWSAALVALEAVEPSGPVTVTIRDAAGQVLGVFPSQVEAQSYPVEDIPLNRAMTQLRSQPDPRKDREAEAIWAIYLTHHPRGVWGGGRFALPVDPGSRYSARFGDTRRYLYSDGTSASDVHRGVDFAVPVGTPVAAPAAGTVVLVADRALTGTTIVLEHAPGVYSIYFHLSRALVAVGKRVEVGTRLALSGATGLVTGPHLHWEVKVNGVSVDPLTLVAQGVLDKDVVLGVISSVERTIP